jgi:hypothetical protein
MRPGIAARLQRNEGDGDDRQKRDQRDEERRRRPGEIAALLEARNPPAKKDLATCVDERLGVSFSTVQ